MLWSSVKFVKFVSKSADGTLKNFVRWQVWGPWHRQPGPGAFSRFSKSCSIRNHLTSWRCSLHSRLSLFFSHVNLFYQIACQRHSSTTLQIYDQLVFFWVHCVLPEIHLHTILMYTRVNGFTATYHSLTTGLGPYTEYLTITYWIFKPQSVLVSLAIARSLDYLQSL